jgi:hypothetical protein
MGLESRTRDECCRNRRRVGGGDRAAVGLPGAAGEAADGGICIAENVSGMRVDYASSEGGLPGVWEGAGERWGRGSRMSCGVTVRIRNFRVGVGLVP